MVINEHCHLFESNIFALSERCNLVVCNIFAVVVFYLITAEGHAEEVECVIAFGKEPNPEDDACETFTECMDYVGVVQKCDGGKQFDFTQLVRIHLSTELSFFQFLGWCFLLHFFFI